VSRRLTHPATPLSTDRTTAPKCYLRKSMTGSTGLHHRLAVLLLLLLLLLQVLQDCD